MPAGYQRVAPDGLRAFDANSTITAAAARAFHSAGFRAAIRYVRRDQAHAFDITAAEAQTILNAGLALGIVQHVAPEGWRPSAALGTRYGATATQECTQLGLPAGVNVWCDLEGVRRGVRATTVIEYLNNWWHEIAAAGYLPGLYVGWHAGISARQLYADTRFQYFWAAYNLNADEHPATRGVCMTQALQKTLAGVTYDPDTCQRDHLGNQAVFLAGSELWPEV